MISRGSVAATATDIDNYHEMSNTNEVVRRRGDNEARLGDNGGVVRGDMSGTPVSVTSLNSIGRCRKNIFTFSQTTTIHVFLPTLEKQYFSHE